MKPLTQVSCFLALTAICFLLAPSPALAQAKPTVRAEMLVTTEWLAQHRHDPKISIIHVAAERKHYDDGHIPGARFLASRDILAVRNGVPNELPPVAELQKVLTQLGIGDEGRVVIYGDNSGLLAARAYFTLDYLGHGARAALLDGGLEKWQNEKREITTEAPKIAPAQFTPRVRPSLVVELNRMRDLSWVAVNVPANDVAIIDARPEEQYVGKPEQRSGHIPGAASLYWMHHLASKENPVLKPAAELRKMYEAAGVMPADKVVTYCKTGMQASHAYFTAKYLGYDVAMYDASMTEWSKVEDAPLVTGKERQ